MPKWLIEVSDIITGALIIRGQRFTAGRYVTENSYIAERVALEDARYFSVRELEEDEEVETGTYEPEASPTGMLTTQDIKHPVNAMTGKKPCAQCGVEYKSLAQHGRLSGHDVHGADASKKVGDAEDAKTEEGVEPVESEEA